MSDAAIIDAWLATTPAKSVMERRRKVLDAQPQIRVFQSPSCDCPETMEWARFYYATGKIDAVASEFGVSPMAVSRRLRKYGFFTRLHGKAAVLKETA